MKIAALSSGTATDKSWGNDVANGSNSGAKALGAKLTFVGELNTASDFGQQTNSFASAGYNVVIVGGASGAQPLASLAPKYPKTKFILLGGGIASAPNVVQILGNYAQGDFVAGVLAGLMTKTNKVGAIVGAPSPRIIGETEAFILGARSANPKVVGYSTDINSFDDASKAKAASEALATKGVDILFSGTEQATQGMYEVAEDSNSGVKWVIPQYYDSYSLAPSVVLTTVQYDLAGQIVKQLQLIGDGKWDGGAILTPGLSAGTGALASYHGNAKAVPANVQAQVKQVTQDIIDGKITIPTLTDLGTVGAGTKAAPIKIPASS